MRYDVWACKTNGRQSWRTTKHIAPGDYSRKPENALHFWATVDAANARQAVYYAIRGESPP